MSSILSSYRSSIWNNKSLINVHRLYVYISTSCLSAAASAVLECVSLVTCHHYSATCDLNGLIFCHLFTSCHSFVVKHGEHVCAFDICSTCMCRILYKQWCFFIILIQLHTVSSHLCAKEVCSVYLICADTPKQACILVYPGWSFHSALPYNGCMIAQNSPQMLKENVRPSSQKCTSVINQWPCQPSGPQTTSFSFLFFFLCNRKNSRFFPGTDRSEWSTLSELLWSHLVGRSPRFQRY